MSTDVLRLLHFSIVKLMINQLKNEYYARVTLNFLFAIRMQQMAIPVIQFSIIDNCKTEVRKIEMKVHKN